MALSAKIIIACAVLHNLCLIHGDEGCSDEAPEDDLSNQLPDDPQGQGRDLDRRGERRRLQLLDQIQRRNRN